MEKAQFAWQRVVIKVGSALISPDGNGCKTEHLLAIARFIIAARHQDKQVILVSSGSVAAGRNAIAHHAPLSLAGKQAMAAVGQTRMMANWARLFDFPCAQILLTHQDIASRARYLNIKNTLRELLDNGVLPIVNENDTVATEELKFGDNDNLAAQVALVADADTLVICTDVEGVFDKDPRSHSDARLLAELTQITESTLAMAGGSNSGVGTGGMLSKLQAAQKASAQGIQTFICNGQNEQALAALARGQTAGTRVLPQQSIASAKKHWLKHSLKAQGQILIDEGAHNALKERGASLLPAGIIGVEGKFNAGDAVDVCLGKQLVARGLSAYSSAELQQIKGLHSQRIATVLGYSQQAVALHRDDLVLL